MKQQSFLALLYNEKHVKIGVIGVVLHFQTLRLSQHSINSANPTWF